MSKKRPVVDLPEEVTLKYSEVTPAALEEAFSNGARAAIRGMILGIEGEAQQLKLTAEVLAGGIEDAYDMIEEHYSTEHADMWLGYLISDAQQILKIKSG